MKKVIILISLGLVIVLNPFGSSGPARAQEEGNIFIFLHSGSTLISSPAGIRKYWMPQPNFGFGVGYSFTPKIAMFAEMDYHAFSLDQGKFEEKETFHFSHDYYEEYDYNVRLFNFSGNIKYTLYSIRFVKPYLTAGAGFLRFAVSENMEHCWYDRTSNSSYASHCNSLLSSLQSESAAFLQAGAGMDFFLGRSISLYLEGKYALGFTEIGDLGMPQYYPLNLGISVKIK